MWDSLAIVGFRRSARCAGMMKQPRLLLLVAALAALLPGCSWLPGTGPKSTAVKSNARAELRSDAALPYALVDISAETT